MTTEQTTKCKVCSLPAGERDLVEGGVLSGWSPRSVAARFGTITRKDVLNHMRNCVEKKNDEKEEECR